MSDTHSVHTASKGKKMPIEEENVSIKQGATDSDDVQLEHLGVTPSKLERNFNIWSTMFMSFCTSVTWEAITSSAAQAFTSGGSSSFVWGFAASAVGIMLVVLCTAEYASMIPTAGGQYHYVAKLSPPQYRRILTWFAGWITILGWILCATAGTFANAMQIQSWAILFSEDYVYQRWHTSLIVIGLTTFFTLFAIFEVKRLHQLIFVAMFAHVFGYLATPTYLLVHVHPKNSAEYVFTDTTNLSGWESSGIAWSIGLLTSAVSLVGWDSSIHMAEEMTHPSRDLPRSMIVNIAVSGLMTFPWVIAIAFCFTDIAGVLNGPVGRISPFAQLFYNVSGGSQAATIGLTIFLPLMSFCGTGSTIISATSRVVWSFARDGGLPAIFAQVSDKKKVPTASLIATWALICALSLIYVGNATAYYGISSGCTVTLIVSYCFPILLNAVYGFKHCDVPRGEFSLGRYHRVIAFCALAWSLYLSIFLCFPTLYPVTATNMNYAGPVLGSGILVSVVSWFVYGKKTFTGVGTMLVGH